MSSNRDGFDQDTALSRDPLGGARTTLRACPVVSWTDARGPHEHTLEGRAVVGSAAAVDLVVSDPTVSRLHAEFELRDGRVWVRDLGSRNGTFVDGLQVVHAAVPDGSTVQLGESVLRVQQPPAPVPVELWPDERFGPLLGQSTVMRELFARLARIAATDATVLIHGDTGTGKELVAQAIHAVSPREDQPYVIVDCAALPENLLEDELFGHAKGAFTGASTQRIGAIESADGGTLFLDEIGELPLTMQPKLLRVLESRTVRRIGESTHRRVNVRFVSATHRDVRTMVNEGLFREDLYFRLAVVPIEVPPLRDHLDDIPLLVASFLQGYGASAIDPALLRELMARPWRGNVRELRNFLERARAIGPRAALDAIRAGDTSLTNASPASKPSLQPSPAAPPFDPSSLRFPPSTLALPLSEARERLSNELEREYVRALLEAHGHNVTAAAQFAGVNRSYIHRLMRKHEL